MRSFCHGHSPFFRIFLCDTTSVSSYVLLFLQFSLSVVPSELMFQHTPADQWSLFMPLDLILMDSAAGPDPNGFGGVVIVSRLMLLFGLTALCNPLACKRNHQLKECQGTTSKSNAYNACRKRIFFVMLEDWMPISDRHRPARLKQMRQLHIRLNGASCH